MYHWRGQECRSEAACEDERTRTCEEIRCCLLPQPHPLPPLSSITCFHGVVTLV